MHTVSTFETIISVIEVVKEGVSLACSDAAAMHILRFWGDNHIDKLKRTLLKSVDAATPDRLEFAPAFQNDLSELGRLTEKIENILPGYSFFDTKLLHTHAKDLIVSKICNRTLNDILMCYVNAKGRDVVPCKLEGTQNPVPL